MAVLYTGAVATKFLGNAATSQNVFAIENGRGSNRLLVLRRGSIFVDHGSEYLATVKTIATAYKGSLNNTNQDGVMLSQKVPFDSTQTSDPNIRIWTSYIPDLLSGQGNLTTTNTTKMWRAFVPSRQHITPGAGIIIGASNEFVPSLAQNMNYDISLYPGETLIVVLESAAAGTNALANTYLINVVWTEETLPTYTITGTVTLNAVAVQGAEVTVVVADDNTLTNAFLHSVQTTNASGIYTATIQTGKVAYVYAQNFITTNTYYTAAGKPYIT